MIRSTITGIQQAQRAMLKTLAAVKPSGGLGRALQYMTAEAHRFLVAVTHVDTGAYRGSQIPRQETPSRYRIYINPSTTNPRTGARPSRYGPVEEARGGSHAAYERTYHEGPAIAGRAVSYLLADLP